jgi:hypothetical protein
VAIGHKDLVEARMKLTLSVIALCLMALWPVQAQTCDPNVDFTCVIQPAPCDYSGGFVVLKITTLGCALEQRCQSGLICTFDYTWFDVYYGTTCDNYQVVRCAAPGEARLVPDVSPEVIPALLLFHLPHPVRAIASHQQPVRQVNLSAYDRRFWWKHKI